jgi:hypothetical protein
MGPIQSDTQRWLAVVVILCMGLLAPAACRFAASPGSQIGAATSTSSSLAAAITVAPTGLLSPFASPTQQDPAATTSPSAVPTLERLCAVNRAEVNLREGPSTRFRSLGMLTYGTRFVVSERTGDGSWFHGATATLEGWVASAYLGCDAQIDLATLPTAAFLPFTYTPPPLANPWPTTVATQLYAPRPLPPVPSSMPWPTPAPTEAAPLTVPAPPRSPAPIPSLPSEATAPAWDTPVPPGTTESPGRSPPPPPMN